ncbi:MAG: hypothetical protein WA234_07005 [Rectinemataceae bacterium]
MTVAAAFLLMVKARKPGWAIKATALFRINKNLFREILSKSGMMLFSETAWVVSETVIVAIYNGRGGAETVAGMAAGFTIANLIFLVFPAIHTSGDLWPFTAWPNSRIFPRPALPYGGCEKSIG